MSQLTFPLEHFDSGPERSVQRPIHYLGSKLRILEAIVELTDLLAPDGGTACDLFAGSGAVSRALGSHRPVVSVDIQEYSRVLSSALLNPVRPEDDVVKRVLHGTEDDDLSAQLEWSLEPLIRLEGESLHNAERGDPEPLCQLLEYGSIVVAQTEECERAAGHLRDALLETCRRLKKRNLSNEPSSVISRHYGGLYFGYRQAVDLDVLLSRIAPFSGGLKDLLNAAVLSTASELVNTVGKQFAQPLRPRYKDGRPKNNLWVRVHRDRSRCVFSVFEDWLKRYAALPSSEGPSHAIRMDYQEFLRSWRERVAVFYVDPPYTRDHYSRFYHVLETMCLRDNPRVSRSNLGGGQRLSRGVYRIDRHQSPFCIRSQAPKAFDSLFGLVRPFEAPLLLSYSPYDASSRSRPRLLSIDTLREIAQRYFANVSVESAGLLSHSKLNRTDLNVEGPREAELFIICRP